MKHVPQRRPRETWLDLFKTALVYGMIATHVIQLLGFGMGPGLRGFADFINLITFSGFMLAFGMGLGLSGVGRGGGVLSRLALPSMLLLALYASSLGFAVLVDGAEMSRDLLIDVVTQRVMFGWSEFLASFFVLSLLLAFTRRPLIALADRPLWTAGAALACLATTWIVVSTHVPFLAAIVGTRHHASFPLLAYMPWFLIGLLATRHGGAWRLWSVIPAGLATLAFGLFVHDNAHLPERFPPSALWIAGPALFLWLYGVGTVLVAPRVRIPGILLLPGRNVLTYLVASNLMIFTIRHLWRRPVDDAPGVVMVTLGISAVVSAGVAAYLGWRRTRRPVRHRAEI